MSVNIRYHEEWQLKDFKTGRKNENEKHRNTKDSADDEDLPTREPRLQMATKREDQKRKMSRSSTVVEDDEMAE